MKQPRTSLWSQLPSLIHLPTLSSVHIELRQPAAKAAACFQANQMIDIEDLRLGGVAHDGDLSRPMWLRNFFAQR